MSTIPSMARSIPAGQTQRATGVAAAMRPITLQDLRRRRSLPMLVRPKRMGGES